ncbi:MAG: FeoB-associated Cys-rich membrane protein [Clostridia bacterium]
MDILLSIVILIIFGLAVAKIVRDKKKGSKCSSCPYAGVCSIAQQSNLVSQCDIDKYEQDKLITNL